MKIEFLEGWKHEDASFEKGDRKSFDDATGKFFCKAGIGKDLSGTHKTGKKDINKVILLNVDNANQAEDITNG